MVMLHSKIGRVMEEFEQLPHEEKEYVVEIFRKQMVEERRESLSVRAAEAKENYRLGNIKRGTIEDLQKDLDDD